MKDEIKEILEEVYDIQVRYTKPLLKRNYTDKDYTIERYEKLVFKIKNIITNLQEEKDNAVELLKYYENVHFIKPVIDNTKEMLEMKDIYNKNMSKLQEENERLHIRIKTIKRRRKAQTAKMRKYREEITNKQNSIVDYKSRNEKAIEYIKKVIEENEEWTMYREDTLLNILQGEDKDE